MNHALRFLFFVVVVRPLLLVVMGLNVRRRELLPGRGPAVVVANHNSHLDVLALMTLFPLRMLPKIRPVAASDYFLRNRFLAWFSLNIMGIIPIERLVKGVHNDPLAGVVAAIERGDIVIVFPEGSRGDPERMGEFKHGVAHLCVAVRMCRSIRCSCTGWARPCRGARRSSCRSFAMCSLASRWSGNLGGTHS